MEANVGRQSEYFMNHPKLSAYGEAVSAVKLCDESYDYVDCRIGYMSQEFLEIGCIQTTQGRLPEADNEVAMDARTLTKLGITVPKLGQTITLRYYENNDEYYDENRRTAEFVLVGVLENYTNVWNGGRNFSGALVTKECFETFDYEGMNAYIYKLAGSERHSDHTALHEEILSGAVWHNNSCSYCY
ncbi:MAG: hypothetical protein IJB96_03850 [Lachnospira sp.]|nr:hypothetical protein [Lachnospira sp.]